MYTIKIMSGFDTLATSTATTIQQAGKVARRMLDEANAEYGWDGNSIRWSAIIFKDGQALKAYKLINYTVKQVD